MAINLPTDEELIRLCEQGYSDNIREGYSDSIRVVRISDTIIVKFGLDVTRAEAATQSLVWRHADPNIFRVSEPYRFFQDKSRGPDLTIGYLVMEYIEGTSLSTYLETATVQEQETAVKCVFKILDHLKTIPLPKGQGPGPIGGGPLRGHLWSDSGIVSRFSSVSEMANWLNQILSDYAPNVQKDSFNFESARPVLCHMDLAPRNILWLGGGQLALLDWGSAGFYPSTFEVYAFRTRINQEPFFAKILPLLPQDESTEQQIQLLAKIEWTLIKYGDIIKLYLFTAFLQEKIVLTFQQ